MVEPPNRPPTVPPNFRKGARTTWHQRRRHRAVLYFLGKLKGTVLDYGCGYGDLTYAISRTHEVQGVDVDTDRVAFAATEYAPIAFTRCEAEQLPFPDRSFDNVASVVVIHFVPDPVRYLREVHRVLRDGGPLLLVCKNVQVVRNFFRRAVGRGPSPSRLWVRPREEILQHLRVEGFQVEDESYFYDPPFSDCKGLGALCVGLIEQLLSVLRVRRTCGYYVLLARKVPKPDSPNS